MLSYNEFKDLIVKNLENRAEEIGVASIKTTQVTKINKVKDAIAIMYPGNTIGQNFYPDELYKFYKLGADIASMTDEQIISDIVDKIITEFKKNSPIDINSLQNLNNMTYENIKDRIFTHLINRENNKEMLETVPNRNFMDLSMVYRIDLQSRDDIQMASAVITNKLAEHLGIDEETLYNTAMKNTKDILRLNVKPMSEILPELSSSHEIMWVISSGRSIFGAAAVLYPELLEKTAELVGGNYYLIPSSIHEFLAVKADILPPDPTNMIANIVNMVNHQKVEREARLSNQVYFYDSVDKKIIRATDRDADLSYDKEDEYGEEER